MARREVVGRTGSRTGAMPDVAAVGASAEDVRRQGCEARAPLRATQATHSVDFVPHAPHTHGDEPQNPHEAAACAAPPTSLDRSMAGTRRARRAAMYERPPPSPQRSTGPGADSAS